MTRVLCSLLLVAAACGGGMDPEPPPAAAVTPVGTPTGSAVTRSIGPEGGDVATADGRLTVSVPAGALAAATVVSLTPISNQAPGALGDAYRLEPDGQTFALPVTLAFRFSDEDVAGSATGLLRVAYQDDDRTWLTTPVTVDTSGKRVVTTSTHFTDFGLMLGARITPGATSVQVRKTTLLSVVSCPILELGGRGAALAGCDPVLVEPSRWAVNGTAGGSASLGTVTGQGANATYHAPARPPSPPTVQVSTEIMTAGGGKTILFANVRVLPEDGPSQWGGEATFVPAFDDRPDVVQWKAEASFHFEAGIGVTAPVGGVVTVTRLPPAPAGPHDCTTTVVPETEAIDITLANTVGTVQIYADSMLSTYFGGVATSFSTTETVNCPNEPPHTTSRDEVVGWLFIPMTPWDGSPGISGSLTDDGDTWTWNLFKQSGE